MQAQAIILRSHMRLFLWHHMMLSLWIILDLSLHVFQAPAQSSETQSRAQGLCKSCTGKGDSVQAQLFKSEHTWSKLDWRDARQGPSQWPLLRLQELEHQWPSIAWHLDKLLMLRRFWLSTETTCKQQCGLKEVLPWRAALFCQSIADAQSWASSRCESLWPAESVNEDCLPVHYVALVPSRRFSTFEIPCSEQVSDVEQVWKQSCSLAACRSAEDDLASRTLRFLKTFAFVHELCHSLMCRTVGSQRERSL